MEDLFAKIDFKENLISIDKIDQNQNQMNLRPDRRIYYSNTKGATPLAMYPRLVYRVAGT